MSAILKSVESRVRSQVSFKNLTDNHARLYWIDFGGKRRSYGLIRPMKYSEVGLEMDTFVSHPWVAFDHESENKRLAMNSTLIFMPPRPEDYQKVRNRNIRQNLALPKSNGTSDGQTDDDNNEGGNAQEKDDRVEVIITVPGI